MPFFNTASRRLGTLAVALLISPSISLSQAAPVKIGPPPPAPPVTITLEEAIRRAQANQLDFATASADRGIAIADRNIARAALLPGVTYHNQAIYTQPNGAANQA